LLWRTRAVHAKVVDHDLDMSLNPSILREVIFYCKCSCGPDKYEGGFMCTCVRLYRTTCTTIVFVCNCVYMSVSVCLCMCVCVCACVCVCMCYNRGDNAQRNVDDLFWKFTIVCSLLPNTPHIHTRTHTHTHSHVKDKVLPQHLVDKLSSSVSLTLTHSLSPILSSLSLSLFLSPTSSL